MTKRSFAWFGMAILAIGVAAYANTLLFAPDLRPPFARVLFTERPVAVFLHFMGGSIALVVGAFQLHAGLRARFLGAHRWLGRVYVIAIIAGGGAGFYMAWYSFGGAVAQLGFGLLAVCWVGSTLNAWRHVRQRNLGEHRNWMIRSYALTLAAVTLRLYLPPSQIAGISMAVAYPIIAWLCWVPNLLIAEWFVRSQRGFARLPDRSFKTAIGPTASM